MATERQIAAAAHPRDRVDRANRVLAAERTVGADVDPADAAPAALMVRRMANRHGCSGAGCTDPRHAADVAAAAEALDALGLVERSRR